MRRQQPARSSTHFFSRHALPSHAACHAADLWLKNAIYNGRFEAARTESVAQRVRQCHAPLCRGRHFMVRCSAATLRHCTHARHRSGFDGSYKYCNRPAIYRRISRNLPHFVDRVNTAKMTTNGFNIHTRQRGGAQWQCAVLRVRAPTLERIGAAATQGTVG